MVMPQSVACLVVKLESELKGEYHMWDCMQQGVVEVISYTVNEHESMQNQHVACWKAIKYVHILLVWQINACHVMFKFPNILKLDKH